MTLMLRAGDRFTRLVVLDNAGKDKHGRYVWRCKCDCGKETIVRATDLNNGVTKSCGCLKVSGLSRLRHGHKRAGGASRAYLCWVNLKRRCTDESLPSWGDYGGRGITYDPSWESFDQFLLDMGEPEPGHSLDRIDNDGPYSKDNCRWLGKVDQANNRRSVKIIELNGESRTMAEWARHLGLRLATLYHRFDRGWPVDRALTPSHYHRYAGEKPISDMARKAANEGGYQITPRRRAYNSWTGLRHRCEKEKRYVGRINYDPRWASFDVFLSDMGEPPDGMTLDRIDVNGDYCKENCRWATPKEQARNRSNTEMIEFHGERKPIIWWAEKLGIHVVSLRSRLKRWPIEKALGIKNA